jgi:hypothetical protein
MARERFDKTSADDSGEPGTEPSLRPESFQSSPTPESTTALPKIFPGARIDNNGDSIVFDDDKRTRVAQVGTFVDVPRESRPPIERLTNPDGRIEYRVNPSTDAVANATRLQQAIRLAITDGGGTVTAMPGEYKGSIHIPAESRNLTIRSTEINGRRAEFDLTGVTPSSANRAVFHIHGGRNIEVSGFAIKNYRSTETNQHGPPIGVLVEGPAANIRIKNMDIGHMGYERAGLLANPRIGSQPILVNGAVDGSQGSINGVSIENSKIHDSLLGHHEGINIKGLVNNIRVVNNDFKNLNNIGIAIEGLSGGRRPENFEISNNRFENIGITRNYTYPTNDRSAAGVQLDGAAHGRVINNTFINGMHGVIAEREQPGALPTSNVEVTGNTFIRMQEIAIYLNSEHQKGSIAVDGFRHGNNTFRQNAKDFEQDPGGIRNVRPLGGDRRQN